MAEQRIALVTPQTASFVGRKIPVSAIVNPILREALALWNDLRKTREFPLKSEVTPREMAPYLRNVTLFAVDADKEDFEYRIMGDAAVVAWGRSFSGMGRADLNAIQPGMGDVIWNVCQSVLRQRKPLVLTGTLTKNQFDHTNQQTIFLPLGSNEADIGFILSVGAYEWISPQP